MNRYTKFLEAIVQEETKFSNKRVFNAQKGNDKLTVEKRSSGMSINVGSADKFCTYVLDVNECKELMKWMGGE